MEDVEEKQGLMEEEDVEAEEVVVEVLIVGQNNLMNTILMQMEIHKLELILIITRIQVGVMDQEAQMATVALLNYFVAEMGKMVHLSLLLSIQVVLRNILINMILKLLILL